mmetsp:Transcript_5984/g.23844  ORF Transcript_5984/g.23844 Transcript_5984/m.23844 type:complete len:275 (+) Transcript_5984:651-1475(+)
MKSSPSRPPLTSPSYCNPQASVGLLPAAVMPPQAAQLPTATTWVATAASSLTTSIIGRSVPANTWNRPLPLGPRSIEPSTHSVSSRVRPARQSSSSDSNSLPLANDSEGCHSMLMPASRSRAGKSVVSAQSSDMLQPPQPPDCSHSVFIAPVGVIDRPSIHFSLRCSRPSRLSLLLRPKRDRPSSAAARVRFQFKRSSVSRKIVASTASSRSARVPDPSRAFAAGPRPPFESDCPACPCSTLGERSAARRVAPSLNASARESSLCISRMLPGQG